MATAATPDPPPAIDHEKERDRRVNWRATVLSAGVVLLAGVFGSASSYIVANNQMRSQAEQSRQDFLREQRQVQYAKLILTAERLNSRVFAIDDLDPSKPEDAALARTLYDDWIAFDSDATQVRLLGGNVVLNRLADVYANLYGNVSGTLEFYCPDAYEPLAVTTEPPCDIPWDIPLVEEGVQYGGEIPALIEAMRKDLGV